MTFTERVVGTYSRIGYSDYHGFLYDHGTLTNIDVPGAVSTVVTGINDSSSFYGLYLYNEAQVHIWPYVRASGEHTGGTGWRPI